MTVKELYDKLGKLMEDTPNTTDDEIYYMDNEFEISIIDDVSIEYDINNIGRYIVIK